MRNECDGEMGSKNPYLFIVGCPRSGTTLLRRMVNAHPMVAIPAREQHWLPKWFERRKGVTPSGYITPDLTSLLLEYEKFLGMGIGREDLERLLDGGGLIPYAGFVSGVFDLYGKKQGKRLAGDKTPANVRFIPTLHALWPGAKFVHIIRDGRDVALSVLNWRKSANFARRFSTWEEDPITTTALWWEWYARAGRDNGRSLGPNLYHEIRYESLVSEPEWECERLCEFLSIPYDDAMIRFHEGKEKRNPDLDAKKAWLPATPGIRDWRSEMPAGDTERFEAAAGDLLVELGYELSSPRPPAVDSDRKSEVREVFGQEVLTGGDRLPERWSR